MQLSKLEHQAYKELKENNLSVFKIKDLCLLLSINQEKAYNLVKALKRKSAIISLQKGVYSLFDTNEFVQGAALNWPSYLSFWSALSYYKLTDQMPKTIFFASTKYKKQTNSFKYALLSKKRFFGYISAGEITIAEKEKAIIDSLLFPKYAGGINEITNILKNSISEISVEKLIDYALKTESKATARRLGFILESCKIKGKELSKLHRKIGRGYEKLDPTKPKMNRFNKTWFLDINT